MYDIVKSGNDNARYMFVGEAPGKEENDYGRPFIGVSGWEIYSMLEESRWLPPGSKKRIVDALHPYYDVENHRMSISNPDFLPLDMILDEAGIYITNICHKRPPGNDIDLFFARNKTEAKRDGLDEIYGRYPLEPILQGIAQLRADIERIRPTLIVCLGGTALWACTGLQGITKWRGSILRVESGPVGNFGIKMIPTFHPADILREYTHRFPAVRDLRRAFRERSFPEVRLKPTNYIVRPSFAEAMDWLTDQSRPERAQEPLGGDIETPWGWWNLVGHVACIGFATSRTDAICIPLMCVGDKEGYWPQDQEVQIVLAIRKLMTTRPMIFHKGWFDIMHIIRHWGFIPRYTDDTMVMMHVRFPGLMGAGKINPVTGRIDKKGSSLSLAFSASLFCEHFRFWKDDGRDWNQKETPNEDQWWSYCADDCTNMFEVFEVQRDALHREDLYKQYRFIMSLSGPVFDMMLRGFPIDTDLLHTYKKQVKQDVSRLQEWINNACGFDFNIGSDVQMSRFFYNDLAVKRVMKGRGRDARPTLDNGAMETIAKRSPVLGPLCYTISDVRSLKHFDNNMLSIRMGKEKVARNEINLTGTETMRFTSTEDCFGEGLNMQNINRMPEIN